MSRIPTPTEDQEQRALVEWLLLHRVLFLHVPNQGQRSYATANWLRQMGMAPGAPDLFILQPPRGRSEPPGAVIEMKRVGEEEQPDGGVSEDQRAWLERLSECGWPVHVAYGAMDAIQWLQELGYGRRSA